MIIYTPITLWRRISQRVKQTFRSRRTPKILATPTEVHYTDTEEEYWALANRIGLGTKYKLNDIKTGYFSDMEEWLPISAATPKVVIMRRNNTDEICAPLCRDIYLED